MFLPNKLIKFFPVSSASSSSSSSSPILPLGTQVKASVLHVDLNKRELIREILRLNSKSKFNKLFLIENNNACNVNKKLKSLCDDSLILKLPSYNIQNLQIVKINYSGLFLDSELIIKLFPPLTNLNQYFFIENVSNYSLINDFFKVYKVRLTMEYDNYQLN